MKMTESVSYKQLVITLKDASARDSMSRDVLEQLVTDLDHAFKELKKHTQVLSAANEQCQLVQVLLECLRNCCISCQQNQIFLIQETTALETTLVILQDYLIIKCAEDNAELTKIKKLALQFLGNLVAGNKICQDAMRHRIFPAIALELLETLPGQLGNIVCMIIYNCVHERSEVWDRSESRKLLTRILNFAINSDSEWGLLIVECLLKEDKFPRIYNHLDFCQKERLVLLNLVEVYLNDENCIIPENTISFVSDVYKETCDSLRAVESTQKKVIEEIEDLNRVILRTLCAAAGAQKYNGIKSDANLLDLVVSQLLELSTCTKNREENKPSDPLTRDSALGLKRDLIRLIGNLCYKNKKFQDRVRELDGIPAILDNCRIDDKNPYISQWSVFAIRNLCDGNVENQHIISKFDQKGVIDDTSTQQLGINLRIVDGKIRIGTRAKSNDEN